LNNALIISRTEQIIVKDKNAVNGSCMALIIKTQPLGTAQFERRNHIIRHSGVQVVSTDCYRVNGNVIGRQKKASY
jgi:hypothetical protein